MNLDVMKEKLQAIAIGNLIPDAPSNYQPSEGLLLILKEIDMMHLLEQPSQLSRLYSAQQLNHQSIDQDYLSDHENQQQSHHTTSSPMAGSEMVSDAKENIVLPSLSSLPLSSIPMPMAAPASLQDPIKKTISTMPMPMPSYPIPMPMPMNVNMFNSMHHPHHHPMMSASPFGAYAPGISMPWMSSPYPPMNFAPQLSSAYAPLLQQQTMHPAQARHSNRRVGNNVTTDEKIFRPLQQVHDYHPGKARKQYNPSDKESVIDALMGYRAVSQGMQGQSAYRVVVPKQGAKSSSLTNNSVNTGTAAVAPYSYINNQSVAYANAFDPRAHPAVTVAPGQPQPHRTHLVQYPYLSLSSSLGRSIPQPLPQPRPPTSQQYAARPADITQEKYHAPVASAQTHAQLATASQYAGTASDQGRSEASENLQALSGSKTRVESGSSLSKSSRPALLPRSTISQEPTSKTPTAANTSTISQSSSTITSALNALGSQKPMDSNPATATSKSNKRKQPSADKGNKAMKPAVNRKVSATQFPPKIDLPAHAGDPSFVSPLKECSRISFTDDFYSSHAGHSDEHYQHLLDSQGDVTLIAGLMNENSFM
jgi:hypothetical protein